MYGFPFFLFNSHLKLIDDNARQTYGIIVTYFFAEFIEGFDSDSKIKYFNSMGKGKGKGKWCVAKYGDPYSEFVLCI